MAKLKQYLSESEITDDLKGAYTKKGDRYELNELDATHSLVSAHTEVKSKAQTRQTEIDTLTVAKANAERERDEAKQKTVPHGFRAVPKEIAELGEVVKTSGLSKDEIANLKTELDGYKTREAESGKEALRRKAAKSLGFNEDAFAKLASGLDITEDGDKFKLGNDLLSKEFVEKHESFAPFISSLNEKQKKTPFPETGGGETGDIFQRIKDAEKKRAEESKTRTVDEAFGRAN